MFLESFQSTPSRGGWHDYENGKGDFKIFQSTPSRGGWQAYAAKLPWGVEISIHTLAWRVTEAKEVLQQGRDISIHTLAWRVTREHPFHKIFATDFNPHPRVEGDSASKSRYRDGRNFNPHPRVEGDKIRFFHCGEYGTFQSTPSRGGWPQILRNRWKQSKFQSTPSRGGWPAELSYIGLEKIISIHTLAWRVTG